MPKVKKPRRGSMAFYPRKRARRIYARIDKYPFSEKPKILGYACYKVGMGHVIAIDTYKNSPTFNQEVSLPVTVLEAPPLKVIGVRGYVLDIKGYLAFCDAICEGLPKDLERKVKIKPNSNIEKIEENLDKIKKIRLIVCTQPRLAGIKKKKPEVFEIEIGGKDIKESFEYAKNLLGKEIKLKDVFQEGNLVDVISITKGKGTQGPVKRFGVKIQNRHAKEKRRHVGSLGSEKPAKVLWTVPQAGQMGFQRRTEYNKRILKIEEDGRLNPKGGWKRYGIIKSSYILIHGSVPGPKKRLVFLRAPIRPSKPKFLIPQIKEVII